MQTFSSVQLYCRYKQKHTQVAARCTTVISIQTEAHTSGGSLSHCTVDKNRSIHQWRLAVQLYCRYKQKYTPVATREVLLRSGREYDYYTVNENA
jgi:hypothetical protein